MPNILDVLTVHDDWLQPELLLELRQAASWMPMYLLNRKTRFETHELDVHWYYPVAITEEALTGRVEHQLDDLQHPLDIIRTTWLTLKEKFPFPLGLYECTLSGNLFGTEGSPHYDFSNRKFSAPHYTLLVHCCEKWDVKWAGETLIFDDHHEIIGGVTPRPGRVVVLKGDPFHVGRSVSRVCPIDRRVLIFKAWNEGELSRMLQAEGSSLEI